MLNRLASLAMSTSVLKALPGNLDIKRHSPSLLCKSNFLQMNTVGGRKLRTLLELSAILSCHIWLAVRIQFASLAANLSSGQGLLVFQILFFLPPSL